MLASSSHAPTGVLYASPDDEILVLDIPTTIAAAQGTADSPWERSLLSREALAAPLSSLEPKSDKARSRLLARGQGVVDGSDAERVQAVREALLHVKTAYDGPLVVNRHTSDVGEGEDEKLVHLSQALSHLVRHAQQQYRSVGECSYSHDSESWSTWSPHLMNPHPYTLPLHVRTPVCAGSILFHLPPHSAFLLHTLPPSTPSLAPTPTAGFDVVVLDPPWPNRSMKRSGHYHGPRTLDDTRDLLDGLNLSAHLAEHDATIAIWITNSSAVREIVCGPEGWLSELGFEAVEEWVWIKTTTSGEPMYDLEGLWRKPYEVLMIAKRVEAPSLKRRVLVAVPDVHSRKPSLKALLERLIVPRPYHALEVFARSLTATWHSWGNEALLYNWEGHWKKLD